MKRTISVVATVAALFTAGSAGAKEHMILILDDAYFPQVTYLDEGDTVRFVNASSNSHNIIGQGGDWEIGPIPIDGEMTMIVAGGLAQTFFDAASEAEDGTFTVEGQMSYSAAPLE